MGLGFPKPKKKLKGHSGGWKRKAWEACSEFTRMRDASPGSGVSTCISCGKWYHWKSMDAGHYIPREFTRIWLNEVNVNSQCRNCNYYLKGNTANYRIGLLKKHSESIVLHLESAKGKRRWKEHELKIKYYDFKNRSKKIRKEKGL